MKHTQVILDIVWDDTFADHPTKWDWAILMDLGFQEEITVIHYTDLEDVQ